MSQPWSRRAVRAIAMQLPLLMVLTTAAQAHAGSARPTVTPGLTSPAELPRVFLDTTYVPASGNSIAVHQGDDLQAAIDTARPGDEVVLDAGATFVGNFILPKKHGTADVIIRTSDMDGLPAEGVRVSPADAGAMPKIITPNDQGAVNTADGAHGYRLLGIEFGIAAGVAENFGVVRLSDGDETERSQLSSDIVIDRCYVHGNPTENDRRGVVLNGASQAVIDSYVSDFHEVGIDSQAIEGWAGPGPFKVVDNYLEGAAENLMFGGADPLISSVVPSDIEIRHNTFFKPLTWRKGDPNYGGIHWTVKNLFELKSARRVLVDGNVFQQCWGDAQTGVALVIKTAASLAAPWQQTTDVTISNNVVEDAAGAVTVEARDPDTTKSTQRVSLVNNLFLDIDGRVWKGTGDFLLILAGSPSPTGKMSGVPDVFVDHNTAFQTGTTVSVSGAKFQGFVYADTIAPHNRYGVKGDGTATGNDTIDTYFPGVVFVRDALVGGKATLYPPDNFFPATMDDVGFVDLASGNYRLSDSSPYKGAASDGMDVGADIDAIAAATGLPL
jgi:hypothetical protein